ncbi:MAG: hypothetical protein WAN27_04265 [Xanthobacteraceae bacterium]
MTTRTFLFAAAAVVALLGMQIGMQSPAHALTMTECSAKYKDAKTAGTLNGATWNDFRKSQCDMGARGGPPKAATAGGNVMVAANAVFPTAVDSKYSSEKPGRARRKTCLDQYKANKASNANGGLRWLQKGGGYYSQCVKKLKGAA